MQHLSSSILLPLAQPRPAKRRPGAPLLLGMLFLYTPYSFYALFPLTRYVLYPILFQLLPVLPLRLSSDDHAIDSLLRLTFLLPPDSSNPQRAPPDLVEPTERHA